LAGSRYGGQIVFEVLVYNYILNEDKIILDLCGGTGSWSKPYREAGYDVRLITLPDYNILRWREYPDVAGLANAGIIYGVLAAPPCTVFSKAAWNIKKADRRFSDGMATVRACMDLIWTIQESGAPLAFWALENPMGYLYNFLGRPPFYFQPWQFGETSFLATKRTAIWGYFNQPAKTVLTRSIPFINSHTSKREVVYKERENKGWYKASAAERAITPQGFARAFYKANQ
jgi:hypothetical protein